MWILQLNPMTANAESVVAVARAETKEALEDLLESESVEPYPDTRFRKCYRKGGPLEWFNPPSLTGEAWIGRDAIYEVITLEVWLKSAEEEYYSGCP